LLLADVEGSTRLWETQPDAMKVAVERLDQTFSDAVAAHRGVRPTEQGQGDSFVIAFARAAAAVGCALELQRAPLRRQSPVPNTGARYGSQPSALISTHAPNCGGGGGGGVAGDQPRMPRPLLQTPPGKAQEAA
jgi:class 3 adenylate cyclase